MKALVISTKDEEEFKFLETLLKKLGISSTAFSREDLEDLGMSMLLKNVNSTQKVSREEIMGKLDA